MPYKDKSSLAAKASQARANAKFRKNHLGKVKAAQKKWYTANREKSLQRIAKWRIDHPGADVERHLRRKYGISTADYDAILQTQGGGCAVCSGPPNGRWKHKFHVDHDHITGLVRGLLCHRCNMGIGYMQDNPETLEEAAAYLRKAQQDVGIRNSVVDPGLPSMPLQARRRSGTAAR